LRPETIRLSSDFFCEIGVKKEGWTLEVPGERKDGLLAGAVAAVGALGFASALP